MQAAHASVPIPFAHNLARRTSLTRGNGTVTSYGYDAVSRLSSLTQNLAGTTNDLTLGYDYNPASQIVSHTRSNDAYSFVQANANVASGVNGLNQLIALGGAGVRHDARGNVTGIGSSDYSYSAENMLLTGPNGATLGYDPANRLYQTAAGGATTRFGYDGANMIAEYNGANALQRRYVFGPGVDEPLVWYEGSTVSSTTRRYLHADERGSIVAATDNSGNLVGSLNRYDEYGAPQGGSITGRFGYTGQAFLPELGMYYYRARVYNPALGGRFMQTDPIGYLGGMNFYTYVLNDPINLTDPSGLDIAEKSDVTCTGSRIPGTCGSGGITDASSGFSGGLAGLFLGQNSGGGGGFVYVPGIPGPVTGTGGLNPFTVTASTAGSWVFVPGSNVGDLGSDVGSENTAYGDAEVVVVAQRWTAPSRRACSISAPNSSFFFEGRVRVGGFGGTLGIPLRYGLSYARVIAAAPPAVVLGQRDWVSLGLGSVTIQFASSNRIPVYTLGQIDIVTSRPGSLAAMFGGNPAVVTVAVPQGAQYAWVIGTDTTTPGTLVSIYGC